MTTKIKRKKLSIEDVFRKPKYKNLIDLITDYSFKFNKRKLKFLYIRYALCKNHGLNLDDPMKEKQIKDFFNVDSYPFYDFDIFEFLNEEYKEGKISQESYKKQMKEQKRRQALNINDERQRNEPFDVYEQRQKKQKAETLYAWIDNPDIEKFSSYTGCMNALTNLKRLNLIRNLPDKKGNDYYVLTEFCYCCLIRKMCHTIIDNLPDSKDILTEAKHALSDINSDYRYWNKLQHKVDLLRKANLST